MASIFTLSDHFKQILKLFLVIAFTCMQVNQEIKTGLGVENSVMLDIKLEPWSI